MHRKERQGTPIGKPDNPENFQTMVDGLIIQATTGRPDKARKATRKLTSIVLDDPSYDSFFRIEVAIQQRLLTARTSTETTNTLSLLKDITDNAAGAINETKGRLLSTAPDVVASAKRALENNERIQQQPSLVYLIDNRVPNTYSSLIRTARDIIDIHAQHGQGITIYASNRNLTLEQRASRNTELQQYNQWVTKLRQIVVSSIDDNGVENDRSLDQYINVVKQQPVNHFFDRPAVFTASRAGLSLADIEKMPYPPSNEQLYAMTAYYDEGISDTSSSTNTAIINLLFLSPAFFATKEGVIKFENQQLIANLAAWQEWFTYSLLYDDNPQHEALYKDILEKVPESMIAMIPYHAMQYTAYAVQHDPEYTGDVFERTPYHPLINDAMEDYAVRNPEAKAMYADEVGFDYFLSTILPKLEDRLAHFGVLERYRSSIEMVRQELAEKSYADIHMESLKTTFETKSGAEFLDRLNQRAKEIEEVTKRVWAETSEKQTHFLPMSQGVSAIDFAPGSIPEILGIESIEITREGTTDWRLFVCFHLQNKVIDIGGYLDNKGNYTLRAPVAENIPGLYTMLKHIAVLTYHDLVIQEQREPKPRGPRGPRSPHHHEPGVTGNVIRSDRDRLPRIRQSERELIHDVYEATNTKPYRVEIHKTGLHGYKNYLAAVELYNEAIEQNASEEDITWAHLQVEVARKKAYQTSRDKLKNLPARFKLETITDPITGETRYLETWVVEYSVPKPTEEELQHPVLMYENHYKRSSALSSLDQMKPWIIGE